MSRSVIKSRPGRSGPSRKKKSAPTMAELADKYELYQRSVQAPDVEVETITRVYDDAFKKTPVVLREDFCGTAAVCCEWAKLDEDRVAYGVDFDPEPLEWGRIHNLSPLEVEEQTRVHLVEGDVRTAKTPPADIVVAQNFSFFCFWERKELLNYFKRAFEHLNDEGVLFLDMLGGYQVYEDERQDEREIGDEFTYIWEQHSFEPITHRAENIIHFEFEDGSRLDRAFVYEWRMWTMPEIRDLLLEAGFARADVYWEGTDDESGEGTGDYDIQTSGDCDPSWLAYVAGVKLKAQ
ncbi:MAG: class I SAM-dependent methyltransferase [Deltaproteobacteria bacterium]|nr:class I SAM-dependent methyltransferase [Deltaproteobacteria bacterium]